MSIESIHLSLVIPAFNEAARLPPYLASVQPYLEKHYGKHYEVIVVDDGSQDGLKEVLPRLGVHWPELRWIIHEKNRGKGAAVRSGMLAAHGERMLFSDADGATPIDQEALLTAALRTGADLAVGSRPEAGPRPAVSAALASGPGRPPVRGRGPRTLSPVRARSAVRLQDVSGRGGPYPLFSTAGVEILVRPGTAGAGRTPRLQGGRSADSLGGGTGRPVQIGEGDTPDPLDSSAASGAVAFVRRFR